MSPLVASVICGAIILFLAWITGAIDLEFTWGNS